MNLHRRLYFSLFILACFLLTVLSSQTGMVRWFDAQMFRLSTYLLHVAPRAGNFRVVLLDEASLQTPQGIRDLRFLLRKLNRSKAAEIVWLTDDIPQMDYVPVELKEGGRANEKTRSKQTSRGRSRARSVAKSSKKQRKKVSGKSTGEADGDSAEALQWEPTQGERNKLAWMLQKYAVFVTQYTSSPKLQTGIPYSASLHHQASWRKYVPAAFLPQKKIFRVSDSQLPYRLYPFESLNTLKQPLIWYDQSGSYTTPDLSLAIFSHSQKSRKLHWNENGKVLLDTQKIPVNISGQVYSYYSSLTGRHMPLKRLNLEDAYKKPGAFYRKKTVILGQDIRQLQVLTDALVSLDSGATYHVPPINWWLTPLILSLVFVYLLWLLPLLSKQSGLFLGAFLILGIVAAQPVLLILNGVWWPSVVVLMLMLVGHITVYIYVSGQAVLNMLLQKQNEAWFQLGHYQYEKGDYETAITSLLKCRTDEEVLSDLYEIGLSFERKRQYDRALKIYSEINTRQRNYRDIAKRLESINGFSGTRTDILSPNLPSGQLPGQSQQTIVLPQMEMPEFGRYKIEKELGRGAMGVVYLGKDPRINRRVAIKTLDYTQFTQRELKVVKSRFFREAEAAGRLSHNNIVTVYDVGEEDGLAFIAMDYVTGVALSEFTQPDKLLPVAEIYRIIQVVASTLNYAHSQNIVHRDIKPGNIMYNPKSRQIKITDFGIARIIDSVKTRTGSFMGSPSYMAPEQMTGAHVDGRADLYALGASFYQLLCGQLPYNADSLGNLAYKITNEKHTPIRSVRADLPSSATRIINRALQKKPEKRFATGAEMANAIIRGMPE
ncbi:Serine/threonine protein kinase PrkC, regulator of stationary phase [hydrothermal vent metagenome]|uniref:Serine/threonine protein kinase PrkC, regulator of stationary phase n=1 Tax=hydrothermal vent metagenome TaxID=652676 RepID=A0A3B0XEX9_9ZZZZ